jgi:Uma2 family endonuclease
MMTAAEFVAHRHELPDGGRWRELVAGELRTLHPPDDKHGDVVLNLSKAVANVITATGATYAGFDLGVQTRRNPDTVRFPAMSLFATGDRFEQVEAVVASVVPALVVEIASTNDRRTSIAERVYEYHGAGVEKVWVADPHGASVTVLRRDARPLTFSGGERLTDLTLLPGLEIPVLSLFAEPAWWRGKR